MIQFVFLFVSGGSNRVNKTQKNNQKVKKMVKSIDSFCRKVYNIIINQTRGEHSTLEKGEKLK